MHNAPWSDNVLKPVGVDDWWTEIKNTKDQIARNLKEFCLTHLQSVFGVIDNQQHQNSCLFLRFFLSKSTAELVNYELNK